MSKSIVARFIDRAGQRGARVAMRTVATSSGGIDSTMSWAEWKEQSLAFAAATLASEARSARSVAILAGNNFVWPVADIGTLLSGKMSVGIYPTSAPAQIEKMLADCGAGILVVDDPRHAEVIARMQPELGELRVIVRADDHAIATKWISWRSWLEIGHVAMENDPTVRESIIRDATGIESRDPAIIIYTSGSTGNAKGAILSHECIQASAASIAETLGLRESDTTLSFLPYSHAAERIFGLYTRIECGIETALVDDHSRVWEVSAAFKPTVFGGLPRFYEKLYERILTGSGETALDTLGGNVRIATSGGAALPVRVAEELHRNGVSVLNAYGLTEHLCVAMNRPGDFDLDSVGSAMPGTDLMIAPDGEILVRRSELTFSGYNNLPDETRASFTDDGLWVRTGDLGSIDSRGRLRITGRKKELLVLSNGKMVAPLPIEARLRAHPWICHAVLHAEGMKFVSALIVLRREVVEGWARARGIADEFASLVRHPAIVEEVQKAVDDVNTTLSRAESIRRFFIIDRDFSETSELTPTHKVRRATVLERFAAELESLYA